MNATPISSMLWILASGVIGSLGAVGLKAGAGRLKFNVFSLLSNWQLVGGVLAYLASSVLFVKGMAEGELSVLYPLAAMGQVWTLLWGRMMFRERITKYKVVALVLILIGVALIGFGNVKTPAVAAL